MPQCATDCYKNGKGCTLSSDGRCIYKFHTPQKDYVIYGRRKILTKLELKEIYGAATIKETKR
jgi:hypothetical protein